MTVQAQQDTRLRGRGLVVARLAWVVSVLLLLLTLAGFFIGYRLNDYSYFGEITTWFDPLIGVSIVVAALLVGGLLAARLPQNVYGWIWIILGFGAGVMQPWSVLVAKLALSLSPSRLVLGGVAIYLSGIGWLLAVLMIPFALLFFPTGHLPSPSWRWVIRVMIVAATIAALFSWAIPGKSGTAPFDNPFGIQGAYGRVAETITLGAVFIILLGGFPLSVLSLVVRYRQNNGLQRAQLKWLAFAAVINLVFFLIDSSGVHQPWVSEDVMTRINNLLLVTLPAAVAVAIFRYRLFEIDLIIRRTLVYSMLSAVLGLIYFGGVVILQQALRLLGGQVGQSQAAVVISTLLIAALFSPLRRRVQDFVDRRFYRQKYDAEQALTAFAAAARSETDLEKLTSSLVSTIQTTLQPASISLWMKPTFKRGSDRSGS